MSLSVAVLPHFSLRRAALIDQFAGLFGDASAGFLRRCGVRAVAESLDVRGAATWSPDGKWIAAGAMDGTGTRVFKVPIDGGAPVRLVDSVSYNPVWSPTAGSSCTPARRARGPWCSGR